MTKQELSDFKVGDRVEVIGPAGGIDDESEMGYFGPITSINKDGGCYVKGCRFGYHPPALRLITEAKPISQQIADSLSKHLDEQMIRSLEAPPTYKQYPNKETRKMKLTDLQKAVRNDNDGDVAIVEAFYNNNGAVCWTPKLSLWFFKKFRNDKELIALATKLTAEDDDCCCE